MRKIFLLVLLICTTLSAQTAYPDINENIERGNFSRAQIMILNKLKNVKLPGTEEYDLKFQIEIMERIRKDFSKTRDEIITSLKKYYPGLTGEQILEWEKNKTLEMKIIDGEKKYFNNAIPNLFRLNSDAKKIKEKIDGVKVDKLEEFLAGYIPKVVSAAAEEKQRFVLPVKMKLKYTLTVKPNMVPGGEIIRCWLPYPKESNPRQGDVHLISVNKKEYIIASDSNLQRTLYMEDRARPDQPTIFEMELSYISKAEYVNLFARHTQITFYKNPEIFSHYTKEEFPHIVFSEQIKNVSQNIIGDEKDPLQKLKRIFTWVDENTPWASAREYSTISNIPEYALDQKHGDCGIQTLLFMTLCRYNGIPAKWQSGWMMHPPEVNLHDWCEIYIDNYGWIPTDQSFGIKNYLDDSQKYFYLGATDPFRLIVNDDYSKPLFPVKIFPRSETIDFQRGEVEWKGGNLYFDKWNYNMQVEYIN